MRRQNDSGSKNRATQSPSSNFIDSRNIADTSVPMILFVLKMGRQRYDCQANGSVEALFLNFCVLAGKTSEIVQASPADTTFSKHFHPSEIG